MSSRPLSRVRASEIGCACALGKVMKMSHEAGRNQYRCAKADRATDGSGPGGFAKGRMSAEEARAVLEVGADAADEEITKAHRRLMMKLHPDHGGSNYLAARINEAKDVLLGS